MTTIRQWVPVEFAERGPLGITFRESASGGLTKVTRVQTGGAGAQQGVAAGWRVARVTSPGKGTTEMGGMPFERVMQHLRCEQRPLRIEFERVDSKKGRSTRFGTPTKKVWAALSGAW